VSVIIGETMRSSDYFRRKDLYDTCEAGHDQRCSDGWIVALRQGCGGTAALSVSPFFW